MTCRTPGKRIRSKGRGKGLARGGGRGPVGRPSRVVRRTKRRSTGGVKPYKTLLDNVRAPI